MLNKEDYEEQACLLCMTEPKATVPVRRVLERLDTLLNQKEFDAAERLLRDWLAEAEATGDQKGALTLRNEQIGFYRKQEREQPCMDAMEAALALAEALYPTGSITAGTTLVNAATGCKAFGKTDRALELYRRARTLYEALLSPADDRLAGLYNNMALALTETGAYEEAQALYHKALEILEKNPGSEPEQAITYLNLADLTAFARGEEAGEREITALLDRAEELLNKEGLSRDGNYAYVCEKCAPVFGHYGYFLTEQTLRRRAEEFYEKR